MTPTNHLPEPSNVLYRIKRGLSGYVSYLAACEVNQAFSEYVLYEPILRILMARGYSVRCEFPCPGIVQPTRGDRKKVDFVVTGHELRFALEVKWAKKPKLDVKNDYLKLAAFYKAVQPSRSFLCVFGRESDIKSIVLVPGSFTERGNAVYANFGITKYGCRIYEIASPNQALPPTSRARRARGNPKNKPRTARG
jgi:hypothetical protein